MGREDRERYEKEKAEWEAKRIKKIREKKEIVRTKLVNAKIALEKFREEVAARPFTTQATDISSENM